MVMVGSPQGRWIELVPLGTVPEPGVIDFRRIDDDKMPLAVPATIGANGRALSTRPKVMRNRIRAQTRKGNLDKVGSEFKKLYKPIEEWDSEELARGRPRDTRGGFMGKAPKWISRELHEESMNRFRQALRDETNSSANKAVSVINRIMDDDETDHRGKPRTPPSTKLDAAKFLLEQVLGKPKQHIETDISVKMQGMLATAIITPGKLPADFGAAQLTSPRSPEDLGIIDVDGMDD